MSAFHPLQSHLPCVLGVIQSRRDACSVPIDKHVHEHFHSSCLATGQLGQRHLRAIIRQLHLLVFWFSFKNYFATLLQHLSDRNLDQSLQLSMSHYQHISVINFRYISG